MRDAIVRARQRELEARVAKEREQALAAEERRKAARERAIADKEAALAQAASGREQAARKLQHDATRRADAAAKAENESEEKRNERLAFLVTLQDLKRLSALCQACGQVFNDARARWIPIEVVGSVAYEMRDYLRVCQPNREA